MIVEARGMALPGMGETVTAFYMSTGGGLRRIVVRLIGTASGPRTTVLRRLDELSASKIEGELNSPGRHVVVTHDVNPYPGADAFLATRVVLGFAELAEGTVTLTDLKTIDLVAGSGDEAAKGQTVSVHYTGWLANGKMFDSSLDNGAPFDVPLGKNRLIKGWELGIPGMRVGGRRRLLVPSRLGYGVRGAGNDIPPNAVLIFDIELIGVR
ncbi:MAG: FKBP-type peptidyl-prolyl cis-trans isomerase [Blastocatellia bacterium]|jgi:hypothetical protein